MTIRIEIKSSVLEVREILPKTGPNAGKPMTFHEQEAWVTLPGNDGKPRPFPQRITLNIDVVRKQEAFAVGVYTLSDTSFFINRFSGLEIGRLHVRQRSTGLTPLPVAAAQPQRVA